MDLNNERFEKIFLLLIDNDLDPNLSGMCCNFLNSFKYLFKELWDYDFKKDHYSLKKQIDLCRAWYNLFVSQATDLSQDDKWELENYYHKFYMLFKLKDLYGDS